ncbi:hypothetical protein FISHEDRAFT_46915 [Fistulina hepatica ATCC 64428]|uniref:arginyltransferase n=1 Tax=Fistulina hepatica ATCC 64428 TaxID=1128425 RepID=A0A0D7A6G9_9AGAR|nr:hypothetical protein FISHEDRAFT_46915 [Fistulina hepatica ATCC 64428]
MDEVLSIGYPLGYHESTCGYCSPPGQRSFASTNRCSAALDASQLSCQFYECMIDRGWRRSGTYCYRPDLSRSCCPQYVIKLDSLAFKLTKRQRKLLKDRWNRYVLYDKDGGKSRQVHPETTFPDVVHASEAGFHSTADASHRFEVILEPSSFTQEKFELYCKYQKDIHHEDEKRPSGFKRFLVDSPLQPNPIPYTEPPPPHLPKAYGSYHQLYRLDGQLIAMAVLDILPSCVSSVYFMYDKTWERFSLGKLSAIREISLVREIHDAGVEQVQYLYLGFYIHSCPKMRYKGDYFPSYLADPETYEWVPLEKCVPMLDQHRYASFSHPEHSIKLEEPVPKGQYIIHALPCPTAWLSKYHSVDVDVRPDTPDDELLGEVNYIVDVESTTVIAAPIKVRHRVYAYTSSSTS